MTTSDWEGWDGKKWIWPENTMYTFGTITLALITHTVDSCY